MPALVYPLCHDKLAQNHTALDREIKGARSFLIGLTFCSLMTASVVPRCVFVRCGVEFCRYLTVQSMLCQVLDVADVQLVHFTPCDSE